MAAPSPAFSFVPFRATAPRETCIHAERSRFQRVFGLLAFVQAGDVQIRVLVNIDGRLRTRHQMKLSSQVLVRKCELLVLRLQILAIRHDPYLQEMCGILRRWIEFAVQDARARRHMLQFTGTDHRAGAHAVAVLQRSIQNPRQNFHVAMRMHAEPLSRRDDILVQHSQRPELHMLRIVILIERKCESAVQPRRACCVRARSLGLDLNHVFSPSWLFLNWISRRVPTCGIVGAGLLVRSALIGSFPSKSFSRARGKTRLINRSPFGVRCITIVRRSSVCRSRRTNPCFSRLSITSVIFPRFAAVFHPARTGDMGPRCSSASRTPNCPTVKPCASSCTLSLA